MDIRWGYNNIQIKEGDEWKAAFRTNRGLYEPTVMFFGLTNSPATFQMMMNDIFREEIAEGWVVIYMDDILVFSKTKQEHQTHIKQILKKLLQHKLSLKLEKCYFNKEEIKFLGILISAVIVVRGVVFGSFLNLISDLANCTKSIYSVLYAACGCYKKRN